MTDGEKNGGENGEDNGGDTAERTDPTADLTPEQIKAWADAQRLNNVDDRKLVFRQLHIALALILGGAALAVIGILFVNEDDATKLTAIISIGTAVIGSGAALLPTGAAAGASARILSRNLTETPAPAAGGSGAKQT
ncbi:MAG TPA: hypothetical protein VFX51_27645 [Solirubrobacteraceae bacterium]|nr:hypothetical protein [Solirubrobacteraceae bacterium]